ncbi:MAG: MFS transporter [Bacteroidales bacterium]|nr:MFS transporter [Candidatus Sodaliphilus aphodohippi]
MSNIKTSKNFRWVICGLLFLATTINYMDRQVLSLTWKDFIAPEFSWTNTDYGLIGAIFSLVYAFSNPVAGRFIDWIGTKKGYLCAIFVWSVGACMHSGCGYVTQIFAMSSVWYFIISRIVLGIGESGNFPAAIKVTAEYFPPKDRAYCTSIFNAGSTVGALVAPISIPVLARHYGWEAAFIIIGALGFIWMGLWMWLYQTPKDNSLTTEKTSPAKTAKGGTLELFGKRQTWGIFLAKFITDGVWWFFLFWTPAYISDVYGFTSDHPTAQMLIFVLYAITMLSIYGGKVPTIIMNRTGLNAYESRLKAMLIFAVLPLFTLLAQPLGSYSYWLPIILIGIAGAAHQSWSANLFTVCSDLFPQRLVGSITGINGMAGGIGSFLVNLLAGILFDYADAHNIAFLGFQGKPAGYFIVFCYCGVAYLLGWAALKALVPKYNPVDE